MIELNWEFKLPVQQTVPQSPFSPLSFSSPREMHDAAWPRQENNTAIQRLLPSPVTQSLPIATIIQQKEKKADERCRSTPNTVLRCWFWCTKTSNRTNVRKNGIDRFSPGVGRTNHVSPEITSLKCVRRMSRLRVECQCISMELVTLHIQGNSKQLPSQASHCNNEREPINSIRCYMIYSHNNHNNITAESTNRRDYWITFTRSHICSPIACSLTVCCFEPQRQKKLPKETPKPNRTGSVQATETERTRMEEMTERAVWKHSNQETNEKDFYNLRAFDHHGRTLFHHIHSNINTSANRFH